MSRSLCVAAALLMLLGVAQARYSGDGTAYSGELCQAAITSSSALTSPAAHNTLPAFYA